MFIGGSIERFTNAEAKRTAHLVQLLDMGVSLHDATGGHILQSDLCYIRRVQQFRMQRARMDESAGPGDGDWERVG